MKKLYFLICLTLMFYPSKVVADNIKPTFYDDVLPIFKAKCIECHNGKTVANVLLTTYENVRPWVRSISKNITNGDMPPWFADPNHGIFSNERKLSNKEKETVLNWIKEGTSKGEDTGQVVIEAVKDDSEWEIGNPDIIISMPEPFTVPASGVVDYKHIRVNPGFEEDKWIEKMEIKPENKNVVHHIILFITSPKGTRTMLGGWAPGLTIFNPKPGEDMGLFIPAGSGLVFQMHYTTNGTEQTDQSSVGFKFRETPPKNILNISGIFNVRLRIPKNDPNYVTTAEKIFIEDTEIISLMPHMHLRGKSFKYTLHRNDGSEEILLSVPKYNFEWQLHYDFVNPVLVRKNEKIVCEAIYDNSASNINNPDPNVDVKWGDQTFDEMLIGWYTEILPNKTFVNNSNIGNQISKIEALLREQKSIVDQIDIKKFK